MVSQDTYMKEIGLDMERDGPDLIYAVARDNRPCLRRGALKCYGKETRQSPQSKSTREHISENLVGSHGCKAPEQQHKGQLGKE